MELPIYRHTWTFHAITSVASELFLCLFWISLWLKNRCLRHPCFKNLCKIAQAPQNSDSNAQHFLSNSLTHSWFHSMLFALPGYQFPYIVMNRCLYLRKTLESKNSFCSLKELSGSCVSSNTSFEVVMIVSTRVFILITNNRGQWNTDRGPLEIWDFFYWFIDEDHLERSKRYPKQLR